MLFSVEEEIFGIEKYFPDKEQKRVLILEILARYAIMVPKKVEKWRSELVNRQDYGTTAGWETAH
jgi:hypothetical protein